MSEIVHGRASTYESRGCRCEPCRAAKSAKNRRSRAAGRARLDAGAVVEHGLLSTYTNYLCRCAPCRSANAEYIRQYRLIRAYLGDRRAAQ